MRLTSLAVLSGFLVVAKAHFQLQFPAPRGPFVEPDEPKFCDNYINAVDNRTTFPLTGGFINLESEHPKWTLGILVSTVQNPNSFDNFTDGGKSQFVFPFSSEAGEGSFCLPIDLSASNATGGIKDGQNITLEFVFDGGDGMLYQCADLTVSSSATTPKCSNATGTSSSSSASGSQTAPASKPNTAMGNAAGISGLSAGLLSLLGFAIAV